MYIRIDKFYMLIRRFVNASFRLLQRSGWKAQNVEAVNRILQGEPAEGKNKGRAGPLEYVLPDTHCPLCSALPST